MINLVLTKSIRNLALHATLCRTYHVGKASSVNTAIARGLRKSQGMGFRGKKVANPDDPREVYRKRNDLPAYEAPPRAARSETVDDARRTDENRNHRENRAERRAREFGAKASDAPVLRGRFGEILGVPRKIRTTGREDTRRNDRGRNSRAASSSPWDRKSEPRSSRFEDKDVKSRPSASRPSQSGFESRRLNDRGSSFGSRESISSKPESWDRDQNKSFADRAPRSDRSGYKSESGDKSFRLRDSSSLQTKPWESGRSKSFEDRGFGERAPRTSGRSPRNQDAAFTEKPFIPNGTSRQGRFGSSGDKDDTPGDDTRRRSEGSTEGSSRFVGRSDASRDETTESKPRFTQTIDNRIPLSIPYTTPASEFLYGTSVVEAALSSRRSPRRKLYKLYIYSGENRENTNQDAKIERLAHKNGVQVMRVSNDWIRLMDKMSAGRPHNGYILEASPLPRLPVLNLGRLKTFDGKDGFSVAVDHQSREEAAVNGTSNFIKTMSSVGGRKPFVLLLDSIVDPGNLGGIIRTASFLGVSAIAISARNSAPFSPVVLKASAGASENVTLFTVNKPSGFIVDSKANGWRVFAAVAPSKKGDPAMPMSISTNDLEDPLSEDPCILMLGAEGEGLRWNLRSHADVDLYIQGSGKSHNVDSLNVSVATGILCDSFLRRRKYIKDTSTIEQYSVGDTVAEQAAEDSTASPTVEKASEEPITVSSTRLF